MKEGITLKFGFQLFTYYFNFILSEKAAFYGQIRFFLLLFFSLPIA